MPFAEEFLITAAREIESRTVVPDFDRAREYIMEALDRCAQIEPAINLDNVDIYIHGSYANKSNIYFPSNLEIMVELTTSKRFSPEEVSLEGNYFVDVPLQFGPKEFRQLFAEALYEIMGDKMTEHPKHIRLTELEKIKHDVDITPALSFHFYNNHQPEDHGKRKGKGKKHATPDSGEVTRTRGVLLYDSSIDRNIVSFPRVHAQNGFDKDRATDGNFKRMVRLFKTLHSLNVNEFGLVPPDTASGYFIECLLYNVPDKLFADATAQSGAEEAQPSFNEIFNKIMNYLMNVVMDDFMCQNEIWKLFGDAAEFWDTKRADTFRNGIIRLYTLFPVSRTFLA